MSIECSADKVALLNGILMQYQKFAFDLKMSYGNISKETVLPKLILHFVVNVFEFFIQFLVVFSGVCYACSYVGASREIK